MFVYTERVHGWGEVGWGGVGLLIPISRESKEKDVAAMLDELAIVSS